MTNIKTLMICLTVVVAVVMTSSLAAVEQKRSNGSKKTVATKPKKKPQADAPLPSKKCMCMILYSVY